MYFPFYIAKRYAISFSKNSAINTITIISSIAIVASAMSLFVFLSIFSGLRDFTLSYSNSSDPDFKIEPSSGKSFYLTEKEDALLKGNQSINSYSKIIEDRVLFRYNNKEQIATIKGVDKSFSKVTKTSDYVYIGTWIEPNSKEAIIGSEIARKLSLGLFDFEHTLEAFAPKPGKGVIENNEDAFNIVGLQPVGMYNINEDIDNKYVFCDIEIARKLFQFKKNQLSSIEFKSKNNTPEEKVINELHSIFKDKVTIKTKAQLNDSLYKMLNSENLFIYLFSTLIVILTLFCLAGAIVMIVIDKKDNITTLYNLGLTFQEIRNIFFTQGILITTFGLIIGLVIGSLLIILQQQFSILMITSSIAYPVKFKTINIILVIGTIIPLGLISSWIASGRVNKEILK
ncbi:ABC transporter permease [Flavobacterium sp. J27]|uniref:ABC transporter permease n=1 Tax=Flavobacterium sp. J27 TaxID=2060419 RepID=UPI00102FEE5C|nr:FtsX-like permease family protein [Flavobacterium sp. J27]